MEQQNLNINIDLKNTTGIESPEGHKVFAQGVLLRKVSKFVVGSKEDAVMPIPVFYDPFTGKVLKSTIPAELREEYENDTI